MAVSVPRIGYRAHSSLAAVATACAAAVLAIAVAPRATAQRVQGLDVSDWQGTISWASVHGNGGKQFAFIRSSRGGTTGFYDENDAPNANGLNTLSQRYDDTKFYQNIDGATAVGMFAGPYHFGRPDIIATTLNSNGIANTGIDEANHMLERAGAYMRPGYILPVYDLESGGTQRTPDQLAQFAVDFGQTIFNAKGIWPIVYASSSYAGDPATSGNNSGEIRPVVAQMMPNLWIARWPGQGTPGYDWTTVDTTGNPPAASGYPNVYGVWNPTYPTVPNPAPWKFWQWTSVGHVPGIGGGTVSVDLDVANGDIEFVKDNLVPALWLPNADGQWTTLANWNSGVADPSGHGGAARLPGVNDTVQLDKSAGDFLITLSSGTQSIRRLFAKERVTIAGGSLTVSRAAQLDNTFTLASGVFNAGSLTNNSNFTQSGGLATINGADGVRGSGSLNVSGGQFSAASIRQSAVVVNGTGLVRVINGGGAGGVSVVGSISTAASGRLDLTNNDLVVDYGGGSPIAQIGAALTTGYSAGAWNGPGIQSSTAAGASGAAVKTALGYAEASELGLTSFDGQTVDATAVIIRYTAYGDGNLDGTVDTTDFNILASNFGSNGKRWFGGDFNFDGNVNTTDFNLLAANFGASVPAASPALGALIPEPTAALLTAPAAAAFLMGRQRRAKMTVRTELQ